MSYYNFNSNSGMEAAVGCFVVFILYLLLSLVLAFPVMWLWNWLMPMLFKLPTVTWVEALGLNLLCGFLFRSSTSANYKK